MQTTPSSLAATSPSLGGNSGIWVPPTAGVYGSSGAVAVAAPTAASSREPSLQWVATRHDSAGTPVVDALPSVATASGCLPQGALPANYFGNPAMWTWPQQLYWQSPQQSLYASSVMASAAQVSDTHHFDAAASSNDCSRGRSLLPPWAAASNNAGPTAAPVAASNSYVPVAGTRSSHPGAQRAATTGVDGRTCQPTASTGLPAPWPLQPRVDAPTVTDAASPPSAAPLPLSPATTGLIGERQDVTAAAAAASEFPQAGSVSLRQRTTADSGFLCASGPQNVVGSGASVAPTLSMPGAFPSYDRMGIVYAYPSPQLPAMRPWLGYGYVPSAFPGSGWPTTQAVATPMSTAPAMQYPLFPSLPEAGDLRNATSGSFVPTTMTASSSPNGMWVTAQVRG